MNVGGFLENHTRDVRLRICGGFDGDFGRFLVTEMPAIEIEAHAEGKRLAITRDRGENDEVFFETRDRGVLAAGEIVLPEVAVADEVEAFAIRLPQRPTVLVFIADDLLEAAIRAIEEPDLPRTRAFEALSPPRLRTFTHEEQFLTVRRQYAVESVVIKKHALGVALVCVDDRMPR